MNRRKFIKNTSLMTGAMPLLVNGLQLSVIPDSKLYELINFENDNILVLIQMQGGNDGLNTVIPMNSYDNLAKLRSNIIIAKNKLLDLNGQMALHPALTGVRNLYNDGKLNIIHSVGYPNQNRSHFRSTDIWTSGSKSDEFDTQGWLGKYFDSQYLGFPEGYPNDDTPHPIAISMSNLNSETCQGISANYSMGLGDPFALSELDQGFISETPESFYGDELAFLRTSIRQTNEYSEVVTAAAKAGNSITEYPASNLSSQLKNVAYLISGGLQTKIYVCTIGGFDNHGNQVIAGSPEQGDHANLLDQVSTAIEAFQNDLLALNIDQKVIGMTFSEFGRQIASNSSLGTDHGTAAPLLLFGSCVNAGFMGNIPDIPSQVENQAGIDMQIDFRDIYGTLLMDWFDVPESEVKNLLFADFQKLNLISGCQNTATEDIIEEIDLKVFPNPFSSNVNVKFESKTSSQIRLSIYDMRGVEVVRVFDRKMTSGIHDFNINTSNLVSGNYFIHLVANEGLSVKKLVKI